MRKSTSLLFIFILFFSLNAKSTNSINLTPKQINPQLSKDVGFEENIGQIKDFNGHSAQDVLFSAKLQDYTLFITKDGVSVVMYQNESVVFNENTSKSLQEDRKNSTFKYARYDLNLVNATIDKNNIELKNPTKGITNYYLGDTNATNITSYQTLVLKNVYPGIDWVWRFDEGIMHHEFVVQVGADPNLIKLEVKWADINIEDNGKSVSFSTPLGTINDGPLFAYGKATKNEIDVRYNKLENNQLSFQINNYNKDEILIIDPPMILEWATFYGGADGDRAIDIKTDNAGNVFITGQTFSSNFPTVNPGGGAYFDGTFNGNQDVIMLKFTNVGEIEWATYYGGTAFDLGESLTVDNTGNVFVTGQTNSPGLPTVDPGNGAYYDDSTNGQSDSFIMKLDNNGVLLWSTFYGGNKSDTGFSITSDDSGNIFIAGKTRSVDFPTLDLGNGAYYQSTLNGTNYDFYILKFTNEGEQLWSTYFGGNTEDFGEMIEVDSSGNIFVAGRTRSPDMPLMNPGNGAYYDDSFNGEVDMFITKFTDGGILEWSTYYGGTLEDWIHAIAIDNSGNVYFTGETLSPDLTTIDPGNNAYYDDTFNSGDDVVLLKFSNEGEGLWATYYGGNSVEYGISIVLDESNNLFVTGSTLSANFPTLDPNDDTYFDGELSELYDMFILQFDSDLNQVWSTYYGGSDWDFAESLTIDGFDNMYLTGSSLSSDFFTLDAGNGAYYDGTQNSPGFHDIILLKFNIGETFGLEDNQLLKDIIVYPNPSSGSINVELGELKNVSIKVFDFLGREVYNKSEVNSKTFTFNLNASTGIYILKVSSGNNSKSYKLILK